MMSNYARFALLGLFFVFLAPTLSAARAEETPCRLILNDGEVLRISLTHAPNGSLVVTQGKAERVPGENGNRAKGEENTIELDVSSRNLSLKTSAEQLVISGARQVQITGINLPSWGSCDRPALLIDRDCRVTLTGNAPQGAFVAVHPLAIASVDARSLAAEEIVIIGNTRTKVLSKPGTKVSFVRYEVSPDVRTSGSAEDWTPTADVAAPPVPPAPPTPAAPMPPQIDNVPNGQPAPPLP